MPPSTENYSSSAINDAASSNSYQYWALSLAWLPLATVFGNALVITAVIRERSLKTSTNYLLVSLAIADLLVGLLVQPFSIFMTIDNVNTSVPKVVCSFFAVVDVAVSTASIANLVAISVERFLAVVYHEQYRSGKHNFRISITIFGVWLFSVALAFPLTFIDPSSRADERLPLPTLTSTSQSAAITAVSALVADVPACRVENIDYMLYGSIFAFYIPCLVMLVMYGFVAMTLHQRLRACRVQEMAAAKMSTFGTNLEKIMSDAYGSQGARGNTLSWAMPFLHSIEKQMEQETEMSISVDDIHELTELFYSYSYEMPAMAQSEDIATAFYSIVQDARVDSEDFEPLRQLIEEQQKRRLEKLNQSNEALNDETELNELASPQSAPAEAACTSEAMLLPQAQNGEPIKTKKTISFAPGTSDERRVRPVDDDNEIVASGVTVPNGTSEFSMGSRISNFGRRVSRRLKPKRLRQRRPTVVVMKDKMMEIMMKMMSKEGRAMRKESRATKLVTTVLAVFLICWVPFFTLNLVKAFRKRSGTWTDGEEAAFSVFEWFGYLNSCLNPIIYSLINRRFRQAFRRLMGCHPYGYRLPKKSFAAIAKTSVPPLMHHRL